MCVEELKSKIYQTIEMSQHVTFAELARLEGFKGDLQYCLDMERHNIIWWANMSQEAIEAIEELKREKKIVAKATSPLIYFMDGMALKYPIKKNNRPNKKLQWLPISFCTKEFHDRTRK